VKTKRSLIIGEPTNEQRLAVLDMIEDFSKLGTMVVVAYQERLPVWLSPIVQEPRRITTLYGKMARLTCQRR
jgi:hypothetical protein